MKIRTRGPIHGFATLFVLPLLLLPVTALAGDALPSPVATPVGKVAKEMDKLDKAMADIRGTQDAGKRQSSLGSIEGGFARMEKDLATALKEAEKRSLLEHPDVAKAKQQVADAKQLLLDARREVNGNTLPSATANLFAQVKADLETAKAALARLEKQQAVGDLESALEELRKSADYVAASFDRALADAKRLGEEQNPAVQEHEKLVGEARALLAKGQKKLDGAKGDAQAKNNEIAKDVKKIKDHWTKHKAMLERIGLNSMPRQSAEEAEQARKLFDDFDKVAATLRADLEEFSKKYGDRDIDVSNATHDSNAGTVYRDLSQAVANAAKNRGALAKQFVDDAKLQEEMFPKTHDFAFEERVASFESLVDTAVRIDPKHSDVAKLSGERAQKVAKARREFKDRITARQWPKGNDKSAPGNAAALGSAALKWLKDSPDWGKRPSGKMKYDVVKLVVTGTWFVVAKDAFGRPIQYGLPVRVMIETNDAYDRQNGYARVFDLSMLTKEELGVKQALPFIGPAVGNSYYMLSGKGGTGAPAVAAGAGASDGPAVTAVSPTEVHAGKTVTLSGSGLDDKKLKFLLGKANLKVSERAPTSAVVQLPKNAKTDEIVLVVKGKKNPTGITLKIIPPPTPSIAAVSPAEEFEGRNVTLSGEHLDLDKLKFQLGPKKLSVVESGARKVVVQIPAKAKTSEVVVIHKGKKIKSGVTLTVLPPPPPKITFMTPASAFGEDQVDLAGEHLARKGLKIQLGKTKLKVVEGSDTRAVVRLPKNAKSGEIILVDKGKKVKTGHNLLVKPTPKLASVPKKVTAGGTLLVKGAGLDTVTAWSLGGKPLAIDEAYAKRSAKAVQLLVPADAPDGQPLTAMVDDRAFTSRKPVQVKPGQ